MLRAIGHEKFATFEGTSSKVRPLGVKSLFRAPNWELLDFERLCNDSSAEKFGAKTFFQSKKKLQLHQTESRTL